MLGICVAGRSYFRKGIKMELLFLLFEGERQRKRKQCSSIRAGTNTDILHDHKKNNRTT